MEIQRQERKKNLKGPKKSFILRKKNNETKKKKTFIFLFFSSHLQRGDVFKEEKNSKMETKRTTIHHNLHC